MLEWEKAIAQWMEGPLGSFGLRPVSKMLQPSGGLDLSHDLPARYSAQQAIVMIRTRERRSTTFWRSPGDLFFLTDLLC